MAQVDKNVTSSGIGSWIDGLGSLALLYGAATIKDKFPEQYGITPQNVVVDNAVNEARAAQLAQSNQNLTKYALIGGVALIGLVALAFVAKR